MKRLSILALILLTLTNTFNSCTKPDDSVCDAKLFYEKFNTIASTATLEELNTLFGSAGDKVATSVSGTVTTITYNWYPCPGKPKTVSAVFKNDQLYQAGTNFVNTLCSGFVNQTQFGKLTLGMQYTAVVNIFSSQGEKTKITFSGANTSTSYRFTDCYDSKNAISVNFTNDVVTSFSKNF